MPSLVTALVSHLAAAPLISAVVGDRVSAEVAGKSPGLPYIVTRITSMSSDQGLEGSSNHRQATVLVECFDASPVAAMDLANLVIDTLDGFLGPRLGEGFESVPCAEVRLDDVDFEPTELPGGAEASTYMVAPAFALWHRQE